MNSRVDQIRKNLIDIATVSECESQGGGLSRSELEDLIYELHEHQDLTLGEITTCLPMSLKQVQDAYNQSDYTDTKPLND